jgi:putative DNA primase/helicase
MTVGDPIHAERKGREPFEFLCGALPIFSANEFPRTPDTSAAYLNRWIVVQFPHHFTESATVEAKLKALAQDENEMRGLLRRSANAAHDLLQRGDFWVPDSVRAAHDRYRRAVDSVAAFVNERCELDRDHAVSRDWIRNVYDAYCANEGFKPLGRNRFYAKLREYGVTDLRPVPGNPWEFQGIKLKDPDVPAVELVAAA